MAYQKWTVFTPMGLFHNRWNADCFGVVAASTVWNLRPIGLPKGILATLEALNRRSIGRITVDIILRETITLVSSDSTIKGNVLD